MPSAGNTTWCHSCTTHLHAGITTHCFGFCGTPLYHFWFTWKNVSLHNEQCATQLASHVLALQKKVAISSCTITDECHTVHGGTLSFTSSYYCQFQRPWIYISRSQQCQTVLTLKNCGLNRVSWDLVQLLCSSSISQIFLLFFSPLLLVVLFCFYFCMYSREVIDISSGTKLSLAFSWAVIKEDLSNFVTASLVILGSPKWGWRWLMFPPVWADRKYVVCWWCV